MPHSRRKAKASNVLAVIACAPGYATRAQETQLKDATEDWRKVDFGTAEAMRHAEAAYDHLVQAQKYLREIGVLVDTSDTDANILRVADEMRATRTQMWHSLRSWESQLASARNFVKTHADDLQGFEKWRGREGSTAQTYISPPFWIDAREDESEPLFDDLPF
jgi:hypothetical protein